MHKDYNKNSLFCLSLTMTTLFCNFLDCNVMLCVCTKRVCVRNNELVCKAVRLAFLCQTSAISLPFIHILCLICRMIISTIFSIHLFHFPIFLFCFLFRISVLIFNYEFLFCQIWVLDKL